MSHSDLVEYLIIVIFSVLVSVFFIMLGGGRFIKGRISHLFYVFVFWEGCIRMDFARNLRFAVQ